MLASIIPLFDSEMNVKCYSLFTQKENYFLNTSLLGVGHLDGSGRIDGLEVVQSMGMETLSNDADIFVPVTNISLFAKIEEQCDAPHNKLILLLDSSVTPEEMYVNRLKELKDMGYKFAMYKLEVSKFEKYKPVLRLMDYILLNHKYVDMEKAKIYFSNVYPNIRICGINVNDMPTYERLKAIGCCDLYEGEFFRNPSNYGEHEVSPLKVNYIKLINMVNGPDFELTKAADVIGRDTALVISLLKIVNRMTRNSTITSIRHAAAMLGEKELKKWITTAVTEHLYTDKPSEITRISLLRAKFAENLAPVFSMAMQANELFLMGLFSVLDVVLEMPMKDALEVVFVPDSVREALVNGTGPLAVPLTFMKEYENANWQEASRMMIVYELDMDRVYHAYLDALSWYRNTIIDGDMEIKN